MSKGNQVVQVRLDSETIKVIEYLVRQSVFYRDEPHTVSSWIRCAIGDKLKHYVRSRRISGQADMTVEERLQEFKNSLDMD